MRRFWRGWGVTILFWTFFVGSIALDGRYPRIDAVWLVVGFGLLAILSTYHLIRVSRHIGQDQGNVSYRGVPDWFRKMIGSNENEQRDN